ncbi:aromatic motif membrane protein [Mycoplasma hafezii]|uniref:aromatic motif membrane protein n=1 Tax=Mycoplasma hafezii TaxID=525886 RepID=UPI003CF78375
MKKIFKYFAALSLLSAPLTALSCTNEQAVVKKMQSEQDKFNAFIKQDAIQTILNNLYTDNDAKTEFLNEQFNLGNEYAKKVQVALRYANNITGAFRDAFSFFGDAAPIEYGETVTRKFSHTNWLYYLYHLPQLTFIQTQDFGRDKTVEEYEKENLENSLLYNNFYTPSSNEFIDYVVQEYSNDDYENEKRVYLLTKDGFIIQFNMSFYKDGEQKPSTNVLMYVYTFPKLLASKDKLKDFSLEKYIQDTKSFANYNIYGSNTNEILFTDHYGGTQLRYTVVDISYE